MGKQPITQQFKKKKKKTHFLNLERKIDAATYMHFMYSDDSRLPTWNCDTLGTWCALIVDGEIPTF